MLRRSAKVLSLCRNLSSASSSSRLAEKPPVPVAVPVACQAVVPSPLQNRAQSAWLFTAKSACFFHTNHGLREVDLNYRSPTEKIWPASPRQQKVASRVTRALEFTFSQPTFLETLVKEHGVCIEEVRMSPDMLTAYVLWSAHPECEDAAQHELQSRLSKIRVSLGKALKARHVPKLEFRLNQLSEAQAAVEEELDRLRAQDT